jgi:hypothetical protein
MKARPTLPLRLQATPKLLDWRQLLTASLYAAKNTLAQAARAAVSGKAEPQDIMAGFEPDFTQCAEHFAIHAGQYFCGTAFLLHREVLAGRHMSRPEEDIQGAVVAATAPKHTAPVCGVCHICIESLGDTWLHAMFCGKFLCCSTQGGRKLLSKAPECR